MNRHVLYFAQRVASAGASALVYMLADKYSKGSRPYKSTSYRRKNNHHASQTYYRSGNGHTQRPHVPKNKPYKSMHERYSKE